MKLKIKFIFLIYIKKMNNLVFNLEKINLDPNDLDQIVTKTKLDANLIIGMKF